MSAARSSTSLWALLAVLLFLAVISLRTNKDNAGGIITSDVHGYYGYLHAIFIGQDLGAERVRVEYVHVTPTGTLNKYFAGVAVLLTPFFLAAHAYVQATGGVANGYSPPYEHAIALAALVYLFLGLLALRKVLLRMGISDRTTAVLLLVLGFGSQLAQYTAVQPGWSHVYSFALFAVFLLLTQQVALAPRLRWMAAWGAVLGLIVLVRPVNGLVLLAVPVVLGEGTAPFIRHFLQRPAGAALTVLAGACVVAVQPLLWYAQVGSFLAYGYKGEGFYWGRPAIFQVLFGFRRGLFLWTPVLIPAALSVLFLLRHDRYRALASALYWVAITYVISCWWIWYYGSGFGARVFVEHYAVLVLPLGLMLDRLKGRWKQAVLAFLLAATGLHLAQFYQYHHDLLDREGMDRSKYVHGFLRFGEEHRNTMGGRYVVPPFNPNGMDTLAHVRWEVEHHVPYWRGRRILFEEAHSPWHVAACDTTDAFGPSFEMPAADLPTGRALYFALGFERYVFRAGDTRGVTVVVSAEKDDGSIVQYESFRMEPLPPASDHRWDHIEYRVALQPLGPGEKVKFYFWNQDGKSRFMADDLDMTVMAVRPY